MKAKDYYKKYGERLADPETTNAAIVELIREFARESGELMDKRDVKSDKACMAVLNEMNDKWNALARMFPTEVLRRNGWRDYFMKCLSEAEGERR